jgi:hypothetical protein
MDFAKEFEYSANIGRILWKNKAFGQNPKKNI